MKSKSFTITLSYIEGRKIVDSFCSSPSNYASKSATRALRRIWENLGYIDDEIGWGDKRYVNEHRWHKDANLPYILDGY